MKLYELAAGYEHLLALAEEGDDSDALVAELDAHVDAIEIKGGNIARVLSTLDADADAVRAEETRLAQKRKRIEKNAERLREYLRTNMERCGIERIKADHFTLALALCPQRVEIVDVASIPPEYLRVSTTSAPDKRAILEAYTRDGEVVSGTAVVRGTRLVIK